MTAKTAKTAMTAKTATIQPDVHERVTAAHAAGHAQKAADFLLARADPSASAAEEHHRLAA